MTSHLKFHAWQNSMSWVIVQDALDKSDCTISESFILQEWVEIWNLFFYISATNKFGFVWNNYTCPNFFKNISHKFSNIFKRQVSSSFFGISDSLNRGYYEIIIVCSSFTASFGQFKIFRRSHWLFFSDFFNEATLL